MAKEFVYSKTFQLTPSRRATKFLKESKPFLFISTHALTEGDIHLRSFARKCRISTHALTEGDQNSTESGMHGEDFNSRPHGGRPKYERFVLAADIFQLTPSRRATARQRQRNAWKRAFQLTPSRRATVEATIKTTNWNISTHALTEGDLAGNSSDDSRIFQLTPSRRATCRRF